MQERLDETDLAILHAIERSPRANWSFVGGLVGLDPVSVARRWERLVKAGSVWVGCYPLLERASAAAILDVSCDPARLLDVADELSRAPGALWVDLTSGTGDLLVTLVGEDSAALAGCVLDWATGIPGVSSVRTHPIVAVHSEGTDMGAGTLDSAALAQLPPGGHGALQFPQRTNDDIDWALCRALNENGRRSLTDLASQLGVTEATIRRRLRSLEESGALRMVVEVASGATSTPTIVWCVARVAPGAIGSVIAGLSERRNVKAVVSTVGPNNLYFKIVLRGVADLNAYEEGLLRELPELAVVDRKVVLRPVRVLGRLVDPDGFARETVGLGPWRRGDST